MLEGGAAGERDLRLRVSGDASPATSCDLDFAGTAPQVDGNLNCPLAVTRSAGFFAVRVPDRPRRARPRRAPTRPVEVVAPAGLPAQRPPPGGGRGRQRRDVEPGRRPGARGARPGDARPRAGPGDDEQPHPRPGRASPTTRRSAAARAPARTPTARAPSTSRCRTPSTRPVEALEGEYPLRVRELCAAPRLRRRRSPPRRRRDRARARGARADALHADHRAPPPRARAGATAATDGARAATCSTARSCRPRCSGELRPGDRLRIETPGGGGHGAGLKTQHRSQTWNSLALSLDCEPSTAPDRSSGAASDAGAIDLNLPRNQPTNAYCLQRVGRHGPCPGRG